MFFIGADTVEYVLARAVQTAGGEGVHGAGCVTVNGVARSAVCGDDGLHCSRVCV